MPKSQRQKNSGLSYEDFAREEVAKLKAESPGKSDVQIDAIVKSKWETARKNKANRGLVSTIDPVTGERRQGEIKVETNAKEVHKKLSYSSGAKPIRGIRMEQGGMEPQNSNSEQNQLITQTPVKSTPPKKTKKIKKSSDRSELQKFKTYYNEKLRKQHPKWNSSQINTIIKLLWRKNLMVNKAARKSRFVHIRSVKIPSGRKYFGDFKRKNTTMSADEIFMQWRTLPKQTRLYWNQLGRQSAGFSTPQKPSNMRIQLSHQEKSSSKTAIGSPLSFMKRAIVF